MFMLSSHCVQTAAETVSPSLGVECGVCLGMEWEGMCDAPESSYCESKMLTLFFISAAYYHILCPYYLVFEILYHFWLCSFSSIDH